MRKTGGSGLIGGDRLGADHHTVDIAVLQKRPAVILQSIMKETPGYEPSISHPEPGHGALTDWTTQQWVRLTGRPVTVSECPWLDGPVGEVDVIGSGFFERWARRNGLECVTTGADRGLLQDFSLVRGPGCEPKDVDPRVARFYENTARFDFDVWSEWCGLFRPFGTALATVFSRRLQQLNVPLSPLETRLGITSDVIELRNEAGETVCTAWVRNNVATSTTLYAGAYSLCRVPGYAGPCVRVVFPLPNGSAIVIMRPESHPDGSFSVHSEGNRFGDPGFYFFVQSSTGNGWARYVRTLKETIRVYCDSRGTLRADHSLRIWGTEFLRLHYRMADHPAV